jgi:uncharacterized iron-regulated membrane protein
MEDGAVRTYISSRQGLASADDNWPRLIHEGNWNGLLGGSLNAITAAAMLALLGTGLVMWARRRFRRRPARERLRQTTAREAAEV